MHRKLWIVGIVAALSLLLVTAASGSDVPTVERYVFSSGGESVSAGDYVLTGAVGESLATQTEPAGDRGLAGGFLAGIPKDEEIFLPAVTRGQ